MAAELFADGPNFAGGNALDIHLDEGRDQGLFTALIAAEDLGAEAALAILRDAQFQGAHTGDEFARIRATAIALAGLGPLALGGPKRFVHFRLEELLDGELDKAFEEVFILGNQGFNLAFGHGSLLPGHG
jgi:hypothetical protein